MRSIVTEKHFFNAARRREDILSLAFLSALFAFLLRFTVSPQILNTVVSYSTEGGSFAEKLHPGTYAIFLVLAGLLVSRPIILRGDDVMLFRAILRFSALIVLLLLYLFVAGRAGSAGFVIDSYFVACAAGMVMLCFNHEQRHSLGNMMIAMIVLSALIGAVEAGTHQRLLPYPLKEIEFRPIGLSAHPLALGAQCASAIGFVTLTRWRIWLRILTIFVLFIGVAVSGARAAFLLAVAEIFVLLLFVPWPRLTRRDERLARFLVTMLTLTLGAGLIAVLASVGFLNRFGGTIFDSNFDARVTIYRVFDLVSWNDILYGMKPDELLAIVNGKLKLPYIESAPVAITMLFGLPMALIFAMSFSLFIYRLLYHAPLASWVGAITFLLTALSNNGLSSKAPDIAIMVVLLLAFRTQIHTASRPVSDQLRGSDISRRYLPLPPDQSD